MNEATAIEVHIVKSTAAPGGMGTNRAGGHKGGICRYRQALAQVPMVPAEFAYL
jgi:hypothetical protein